MSTTVEQVKQCRTPQEALLVLAAAIDALRDAGPRDPWDAPLKWSDGSPVENGGFWEIKAADVLLSNDTAETIYLPDNRARVEGGDVIVSPVSAEREVARAEFVLATQLYEYGAPLTPEDFTEAYIKGGPRWLYYTNRDAVMQMPVGVRQAMVADVLLDSPAEAAEMGADVLKFSFDEGAREGEGVEMQRANRELGPAA